MNHNGKTFDLTGLKRHIEWMYGQPIPKANNEATDETKNEEVERKKNINVVVNTNITMKIMFVVVVADTNIKNKQKKFTKLRRHKQ